MVGLSLLFLLGAEDTSFVQGVVSNEGGFEGAVQVVEETAEGDLGCVTVNIPYRGIHGTCKTGQGRLIVRRDELESGRKLPPFCHVHYEKDMGGAKKWCEQGWAVFTAHYGDPKKGECPPELVIGDSYNLAKALIQWVRRLPFIDRSHLHIDGGSAGGYMALAMAAEFFPVAAATPDVPVVNWAYNLNYFHANKPASKYPQEEIRNSPLPVLCLVAGLSDQSFQVFGSDLSCDAYYYVSPIAYLDRITCPVLMVCATGDMAVPMEQMTRDHFRPIDKARFPDNYRRDFDAVTLCTKARKTFEELLPKDQVFIHVMPLQENSYEVTLAHFTGDEKEPEVKPEEQDRPWSKDHQWSLCYLDEGGPTPYAAHTSHRWATSPDSFVRAHQTKTPDAGILTPKKLDWLVRRYMGELDNLPTLADGTLANRLNFQPLEKLDVLTGLLDYAGLGEAHAERLKALYAECPRRPFGDVLDLERIEEEREGLRAELGLRAEQVVGASNRFSEENMDYAVFEVSRLRCTIGNNEALGEHRAWYNGIFSMASPDCVETPFVPSFAGFNLECFFDARPRHPDRTVFFEPRAQPMTFTRIDDTAAELYQAPTPYYGIESWTHFTLTEPYYVDAAFRCIPRKEGLAGGFFGVFWASYINAPLDKSTYFLAGGASPDNAQWVQFCTQLHDRDSTVPHESGPGAVVFEEGPPVLWNCISPLRYSEPFFYGRFRNMVLIYIFKPDPRIRFAHSPSGGGRTKAGDATNPAWDFQLIVPDYEVGKEYGLEARIVYKPWVDRSDVMAEVRKYLSEAHETKPD